jgi:hypothetical protein
MAEKAQAIPVFRGWPVKPYRVLGSIRHENPDVRWGEGDIRAAASEAKRRGGDAIIIRQGAEFGVSKIAGAKGDPLVLWTYQNTALVIKWLTDKEIKYQRDLIEELRQRYSLEHPDLDVNMDVGRLVVLFLVQSDAPAPVPGTPIHQQELFGRKFAETMARIVGRTPGSLAGEWLFKSSLSSGTAISSDEQRDSLGLARVSVEGDTVAIVSLEGKIEMNFGGTLSKGKLQGQIGVGSFTAKCEGAATPEKISISFQSLTPDGMVRGNIVLQRLLPKPNENEKAKPDPTGKRA